MVIVQKQPTEEDKYSIHVFSKFGDNFNLPLSTLRVAHAKQRIKEHLGDVSIRRISYGTCENLDDSAELKAGVPIEVDYTLSGGVGCSYILKLPEALNIRLLCFKCGLQDCPDPKTSWLCEDMCCCLFSNCGFNECAETQILCVGPCSKPAINITTSVPVRVYTIVYLYLL